MKTFCITLPETPERKARAKAHFDEMGVAHEFVQGIHAKSFGLLTSHTYDFDHPSEGYHLPAKHVGLCLSHYLAWSICATHADSCFMVLEDDAKFLPGWKERVEQAFADVPEDWDMLFIGSCNCADKPMTQIKGDVWDVRWPQCTHAYLVRDKAIPVLLETQRRIYAPIDLTLGFDSFPRLKVYTVLPRIVDQFEMVLQP